MSAASLRSHINDILSDPLLRAEIEAKLALRSDELTPKPKRMRKPKSPRGFMVNGVHGIRDTDFDFPPVSESRRPKDWLKDPGFTEYSIVELIGRPAIVVRDHTLSDSGSQVWNQRLASARSYIEAALPAVGCIEIRTAQSRSSCGTGWLLTPDVLVTNRHVVHEFLQRDDPYPLKLHPSHKGHPITGVAVVFDDDTTKAPQQELSILELLAADKSLDLAFLRIQPTVGKTPLKLLTTLSERPKDSYIATIGYPTYSKDVLRAELKKVSLEKRDEFIKVMNELFANKCGNKMVQPGELKTLSDDRFTHDCSTLGGNSGSAILDLSTGCVIGLHFGSEVLIQNHAVAAPAVLERARHYHILQ